MQLHSGRNETIKRLWEVIFSVSDQATGEAEVRQSLIFKVYPTPVTAIFSDTHLTNNRLLDINTYSDANEGFPPAIERFLINVKIFAYEIADSFDCFLREKAKGEIVIRRFCSKDQEPPSSTRFTSSSWKNWKRSSQRLGGGIHEVEQISALSAKVDNVATMVQKLSQITLQNQNVSYVSTPSTPIRQVLICDLCGGGHNLGECLNEDTNSQSSVEHIDLVGYNRPQQSFQPQGAYNPNTSRNHPVFLGATQWGRQIPNILVIEDLHRDFKGNQIIEEPHHNNLGQLKDFNPKL
nr:uncharacterized protein LOC109178838 [Ipomoea batatas]